MRYLLRRLVWMTAALLGVSVLIFLLVRLLPGTIIDILAGTEGQLSREQRLQILHSFGLDRPLPVQYVLWAWNLLHGNLGWSFRTSQPVAPLLVSRLCREPDPEQSAHRPRFDTVSDSQYAAHVRLALSRDLKPSQRELELSSPHRDRRSRSADAGCRRTPG